MIFLAKSFSIFFTTLNQSIPDVKNMKSKSISNNKYIKMQLIILLKNTRYFVVFDFFLWQISQQQRGFRRCVDSITCKGSKISSFSLFISKKMFLFPHIHTTRDGGGRKSFRGQILIILFQIEAKKEIYSNSSLNDSFYAMEIVFKSDKILFAICGCVCMVRLTRDMSHRYIFREFILI